MSVAGENAVPRRFGWPFFLRGTIQFDAWVGLDRPRLPRTSGGFQPHPTGFQTVVVQLALLAPENGQTPARGFFYSPTSQFKHDSRGATPRDRPIANSTTPPRSPHGKPSRSDRARTRVIELLTHYTRSPTRPSPIHVRNYFQALFPLFPTSPRPKTRAPP